MKGVIFAHLVYDFIEKDASSLREVFQEFEKLIQTDKAIRAYGHGVRNVDKFPLEYRIFHGKKRIIMRTIQGLLARGVIKKSVDSEETWDRIYKITTKPKNTKLVHRLYDFLQKRPSSLREIFLEFEKSIEPDRATRTYNHTFRKMDRFRAHKKSLDHRIFFGKKRILIKAIGDMVKKNAVETLDPTKQPWDRVYRTTDKPYVSRGYIATIKQEPQKQHFPIALPLTELPFLPEEPEKKDN